MRRSLCVVLCVVSCSLRAQAQAEPEHDAPPSAAPDAGRDAAILGGTVAPMFQEPPAPADPLSIGGQVYLSLQGSVLVRQPPSEFMLRAPSLLDVYMDARPNDRVRAFVLARFTYDPTLRRSAGDLMDAANAGDLSAVLPAPLAGPEAALDQFWIRFDLGRVLFVTAGKQHVRWGTGHFWSPTDYLHLRRRNPLDVFDARTGTSMLKLHLPIESLAWNLYAYALVEGDDIVPTWSKIAGAARAEIVLATAELGLGVYARKGEKPKWAADLSIGLGDFDLFGELAAVDRATIDRLAFTPQAMLPPAPPPASWQTPAQLAEARLQQIVDTVYPVIPATGYRLAVVGGVSLSIKYNTTDVVTLGVEYFYNQFGYQNGAQLYPGFILPHSRPLRNPPTFLYFGVHYGACYIALPAPFSLDNHSITLSVLANFSDRSYLGRLDYSILVQTHLHVELYATGHFGSYDGELRFGISPISLEGLVLSRPPLVVDAGVALRVQI